MGEAIGPCDTNVEVESPWSSEVTERDESEAVCADLSQTESNTLE